MFSVIRMEEQDFFSGSPMLCSPGSNTQIWNGDIDEKFNQPGNNMEIQHYQQKINHLEDQLQEAHNRILALQNQLLKKEKDAKQNKVKINEKNQNECAKTYQ